MRPSDEKIKDGELSELLEQLCPHYDITQAVLGCCFDVMNELGTGFLEGVYKNALLVSLREKGIVVRPEVAFEIWFRGQKVGRYIADIVVEDKVIVELKCCKALQPEHQAQVINYLKATRLSVGLLVNFGQARLEYKRLHN